jgi:hypothetical protein
MGNPSDFVIIHITNIRLLNQSKSTISLSPQQRSARDMRRRRFEGDGLKE